MRGSDIGEAEVRTIKKSRELPYSCQQMFGLVDNISQYPEFVPWCSNTQEHERTTEFVVATITISAKGVQKSFTTHNTLTPDRRIELSLVDGPFSHLEGFWLFTPTEQGCVIDFELHFDISNLVLSLLVGPLFEGITQTMLETFCQEAERRFGQN